MSWPTTTARSAAGELVVGGVGATALAERFGTPLYVFDEATLRSNARRFVDAFASAYPRSRVVYAAKAYLSPAIVAILAAEGVGLDVVSGGELYGGLRAGVPAASMTFHGNNKSEDELREALDAGVGLIVIDNDWEISLLARLTAARPGRQRVLLRLNPGIDADTHGKMRTGALDSKFGFPIATGSAPAAAARVISMPGLELVGYHAHIGSQILDYGLMARTVEALLSFAAEIRGRHGIVPQVISPGGGFAVADDASGRAASVERWAEATADATRDGCRRHGLPLPELAVEPGRAMIGPAGVALYRVGARKEVAGVRTYVSVDGGMADNIRPTLYGARYDAALANRVKEGPAEVVTIAGKCCESGDVLIESIELPRLDPGDLLAMPMAGAYCLAMASNYNRLPRPAAVLVGDGTARLVRRRETYADLFANEAECIASADGEAPPADELRLATLSRT